MKISENPIYLSELSGICDKLLGKNGVFLVTGASGLIGSCVVDLLMYANQHCKSNFKVYALRDVYKRQIIFLTFGIFVNMQMEETLS